MNIEWDFREPPAAEDAPDLERRFREAEQIIDDEIAALQRDGLANDGRAVLLWAVGAGALMLVALAAVTALTFFGRAG